LDPVLTPGFAHPSPAGRPAAMFAPGGSAGERVPAEGGCGGEDL